MNATNTQSLQLVIPQIPTSPLDDAIKAVRNLALPHAHYVEFVRDVSENILGQRAGSVILCAAPADVDADELIVSIEGEAKKRHLMRESTAFTGIRVIGTPSPMRRRGGASSLLAAYHNPLEKPGTQHRFQLEFGSTFSARDSFYVVSSLLKTEPVAAYVVKNIHRLYTSRGGIDGVIESIQMLSEIAEQSGRSLVLMGSTTVVLDWLSHPDIARHAIPLVLAPYDVDAKPGANEREGAEVPDGAHFMAVLKAYDGLVPWAAGESLAAHFGEVARVTSGSPSRLRKWLSAALCKARANGESTLSWATFVSKQLPHVERIEAWDELCSVRAYLSDDSEQVKAAKKMGRRRYPPGIRNPIRDTAAA